MKHLFLLTLVISVNIYGQVWEPVVESETGTRYSYDSSSLKREGDIVTYWELVDYKNPLKSKDLVVTSSKTKIIQDCKNNRFKVSDLIDYDSHGGTGKIVNIEMIRQTDWYYGKSESINDVFMKLVCKKT
jgi:hypothetical protein